MESLTNFHSDNEDPYKDFQPKVTDFDMFVPWACNEFSMETKVVVSRAVQELYVTAAKKKGTSKRNMPATSRLTAMKTTMIEPDTDMQSQQEKAKRVTLTEHDDVCSIKTLYDTSDKLVQIKFLQGKAIPRKVMQVIGLAVPYHKHLNSITINSGLRIDTLYELSKFLPNSYITELCLDGTFLNSANYHVLLTEGKLKHLSLARCSINDDIVKMILGQLEDEKPASEVLSALNLSTNNITDVGAKYVAAMLRTNRHLSYLNLAGNMITDVGAMGILDTLQKFPLESQESLDSRTKYVDYLKLKNELIEKMIMELQTPQDKISRKKSLGKAKQESQATNRTRIRKSGVDVFGDDKLQEKAEYLVEMKMKPYKDPFSSSNIESQDGVVRCLGNNILCYLNIAYNNITYASVRKLHEVLLAQKCLSRTPRGLIRVVIEGNPLPAVCKEYEEINMLLSDQSFISSTFKLKSGKSTFKMKE